MTDRCLFGVLGRGGPAATVVLGVCAVLLLASAVQAGESNEAAGEFGSEPTADLPGTTTGAAHGDAHCVPSDTVLCLLQDGGEEGRYEVRIALGAPEHFDAEDLPAREDWQTCDVPAATRVPAFPCHTKVVRGGSRVIGTDDSGLFYFYDPKNWEVLIKVLDGCATTLPNHWVFAASASDQGMRIFVRDTAWTEAAAGAGRIEERVYKFSPHTRRPQNPGESDDEYYQEVVSKGHPALTAATADLAFPGVCPAPAASSAVADAGGDAGAEAGSAGSF